MDDCRPIEELLSAYLDGELSQQRRQRVELHVDRCEGCHRTLDELRRIQLGISGMNHPKPDETQWSKMMSPTMSRTSRGLGWLLGVGGAVILAGYAAYEFATDRTVDALVKVAVAGVVIGGGLLLLSVLVDRLRARKTDRYKDVEL